MVNPLSSGGVKMTILNKKNYIPNGSLIYHTDGSVTNHQGFTINHLEGMKASTEYMISFKAKVILGQVKSIGVLKRINHTKGEILLDSVKLSDFNTHTAVTNTTINNGEFHEFIITFTTVASPALVSDNISDANVLGDVFFVNYDQPAECSIEIKDLKWEIKGEQPTKWSRPPEDLTVPFEMIDAYTKDETDSLLDNKANVADVYTKNESDTLLDDKANVVDVYTKTDSYNKEEVDKLIEDVTGSIGGGGSGGGSSVDAYTKVEVDNKLKNYLPIIAGDSSIYANYGYLQIMSHSLEFQVDSFRFFDYDLTSILFEVSTSAIHAHKKLYIYDKICMPDENGDIDIIRWESFSNCFGSSLAPTIIESSEIPRVRYNGMDWNIATEQMVNDAVDQALKKAGTSAIFMNDPDYTNKIRNSIAERVTNDKYKITSEQLNTLILDSGVYHCEGIRDLQGTLLDPYGMMVIVYTTSAAEGELVSDKVFFSVQTAYNTNFSSSYKDYGRKYSRILRYEPDNNKSVIAVKDWSRDDAVPFGYEITELKKLIKKGPDVGFFTVIEGPLRDRSNSYSRYCYSGNWDKGLVLQKSYGSFSKYAVAESKDIIFKSKGVYRMSINIMIAGTIDVNIENGVYLIAYLGTHMNPPGPYIIIARVNIGGTSFKAGDMDIFKTSLSGTVTFEIDKYNVGSRLNIGLSGVNSVSDLTTLRVISSISESKTNTAYDVSIEYLGPLTTE